MTELYNTAEKTTIQVVCPKLAKNIGLDHALFVNQVYYWLNKCGSYMEGDDVPWIYNSLEEWHKQFSYWSLSKLRRIIKNLEKKNILISKKFKSKNWNQTKWYSLNYRMVQKLSNILLYKFTRIQRTDRFVQNEQMLLKETKNNYTNKSSYKKEKRFLNKNNNTILQQISNESKTKTTTSSQEQEKIASQMVQVWNSAFECSLNPVKAFVNKHVAIQLNNILETKFKNDLETWRLYAQTVNSSKFLMGEKETKSNFKAQFLWLIKEETIDAIQNGAYGVGDRVLDSDKIDENLKVCQKEVQKMVQEKVVAKIQENTLNETEEQEFKKYLINRKYEQDGDKYMLRKHMESIGSQYMYGGYITPSHVFYSGNEKYKQKLFQSYLMKKYYGIDETSIISSFNHVTKGIDGKSILLKFKDIREKLKFGMFKENRSSSCIRMFSKRIDIISASCMVS